VPAADANAHRRPFPRPEPPRGRYLRGPSPPLVALVLLAAASTILHRYDVGAGEIARFAAYEVGLVALPGYLLYVALSGRSGLGLRQVVAGGALGYVVQLGLFALTAWAGARGLLPYLLAGVGLVALPFALRARRAPAEPPDHPQSGGWAWAALALALVALVVVAHDHYDKAPLPEKVKTQKYYPDTVWEVALAAEVRHHFPPEIPSLAGEPLRYHYFAAMNEAAIAQVTGLDQPLVNFRLFLVPLLFLAIGGMVLLGREVGGSPWVGVLTAVLLLFVGPLDPLPSAHGLFFRNLFLSDTFLFGLALFLALLVELVAMLRAGAAPSGGAPQRSARGEWTVVLLLLAGCSGAKGTILPVVLGGLALTLAFVAWRERERVKPLVIALGLAGAVFLVSYALLYSSRRNDLHVELFAAGRMTEQYADFAHSLPGFLPDTLVLSTVGTLLAAIELLAPLVPGLLLLLLARRSRPVASSPIALALMLAVLASGLFYINVLWHPGNSQFYFLYYGYAAGAVASAVGLHRVQLLNAGARRPMLVAAAGLAAVLVLAAIADRPFTRDRPIVHVYSGSQAGFTAGIREGLFWIKDNTPVDAVLAVNNQYSDPAHTLARDCDVPAFAERREMLGCEYGTSRKTPPLRALRQGRATHPFADRFRLSEGIFQRGDPAALREAMDRYGVSYLVVDRLHSLGSPKVAATERLGRRVFANRDIVVIKARPRG
jgi:hypothetical protein